MKKLLAALLCLMLTLCAPALALAEPLTDSTAEEIMNALGVQFHLPAGAEAVRYQRTDSLAQMQFTLHGIEYTARIRPENAFTNISDIEPDAWNLTDDCMIDRCEARVSLAHDGETITALCLWYDAAPGLMYSVIAQAEDLIHLDIQAAAEAIFLPTQDEADGIDAQMLYDTLIACTGYAGTAGSSLKNAIAACNLAWFAAENKLADLNPAYLADLTAEAIHLLTEEQRAELTFNLDSIYHALIAAFSDYDSIRGLFDDAGIDERMTQLLAMDRALDHYLSLNAQFVFPEN